MLTQELTDIATRHQVYLERLKAGELRRADVLIYSRLDNELRQILVELDVAELSVLTPAQAALLVDSIRTSHDNAYTEHLRSLVVVLVELAAAERAFELSSIDEVTAADLEPVSGMTDNELWEAVQRRPMTSDGKLLTAFLGLWAATAVTRAADLVRKAVAEGWTVAMLRAAFRGSSDADYTDGLFASTKAATRTTINTAVQHVSVAARAVTMDDILLVPRGAGPSIRVDQKGRVTSIAVGSMAQAKKAGITIGTKLRLLDYRWASILDNRTSQVCRSLDGKTFPFGKGPLPPAHPNCRSSIIAVVPDVFAAPATRTAMGAGGPTPVATDVSYYDWLKTQPAAFQDDALGLTRAILFRKGGLSAEAFARLNLGKRFQPLTLAQMKKLAPRAFRRAGLQ